jgi:hypothetical protein
MIAHSHPSHEPESRLHTLVNWLALAALLALGIFAAPARAGVPVPHAGALMLMGSPAAGSVRWSGATRALKEVWVPPRLRAVSEGAQTRERAPDRELVDRLGAFVGDDALEI